MSQYLQIVILGLTLGGVFALMASGLTLIFGVMGIINLAHAAFIMVAAFMTFGLFKFYAIDPILSVVIVMPAMFLVGIAVYRLLFARSIADPQKRGVSVLLTFAIALVIEGTLGFLFSNIYRSTNPSYASSAILFGPYYLPEGQLYATLASIAILGGLWAFLQYTRTGYAIRATSMIQPSTKPIAVAISPASGAAMKGEMP